MNKDLATTTLSRSLSLEGSTGRPRISPHLALRIEDSTPRVNSTEHDMASPVRPQESDKDGGQDGDQNGVERESSDMSTEETEGEDEQSGTTRWRSKVLSRVHGQRPPRDDTSDALKAIQGSLAALAKIATK